MSLDLPRDESPEIGSLDDLVAIFRRAEKPRARWKIGMEHEKIPVRFDDLGAVGFDGPRGIRAVLERFGRHGFEPVLEDGRPIAMKRPGEVISLEPGGQLELSGRPFASTVDCAIEQAAHVAQAAAIGRELGLRFLGVGLRPFGGVEGHPWMPKARYGPMSAWLAKSGRLGHQMMLLTATVQANYDFSDEADMAAKLRTAMAVSPLVTAIFASSFLVDGKDSGYASWRTQVWRDVDPSRCGMLPFVFDEGFGYRRWVEWALDAAVVFVRREGRYVPMGGQTFRSFLASGHGGRRATIGDFEDHLTTLFPEVRLKGVIEVRGADAGTLEMNAALPALWKGILYDPEALHAAGALLKAQSFPERLALQEAVARDGLRARGPSGPVLPLARELFAIAREGLRRLQPPLGDAPDERRLLDAPAAWLERGCSPAHELRARWEGELGRDPRRLVDALSM